MVRTPCCEKMGLKKGPWTPEEDHILVSYIQHFGHPNWRALPRQAGLLRCGKSCRLRWINYLRPDIKRGNFTNEEEEIIIKLHQLLGNRWSTIAAKLPGRTDNEIKNFWHTHLKKKLLSNNSNVLSKYPNNTTITTSTVPVQNLAISHGNEVQEQQMSTVKEDATWKLITSNNSTLFDHHSISTSTMSSDSKFDEEMDFWYNLFVRSSGDQRVLVNGGDHFGCG